MSIPQESLDQMFYKAATEHGFTTKPIDRELFNKAVEAALLGPTAYNCSPLRLVLVETPEGKAKLAESLMEGNKKQTSEAPLTLLVCVDTEYEDKLDYLCPVPNASQLFKGPHHDGVMNLNGSLQAGYLIVSLRAHGFNCGPMAGADMDKLTADFCEGTKWKVSFLINVGEGVPEARFPRAPRFAVETMSKKA